MDETEINKKLNDLIDPQNSSVRDAKELKKRAKALIEQFTDNGVIGYSPMKTSKSIAMVSRRMKNQSGYLDLTKNGANKTPSNFKNNNVIGQ